jgi:hypothetical protein
VGRGQEEERGEGKKLWATNKGAAAVALALIRVRKQDVPNFLEETYTFQRGGSSSALSALNKSYSVKELVRTAYAEGTKYFTVVLGIPVCCVKISKNKRPCFFGNARSDYAKFGLGM